MSDTIVKQYEYNQALNNQVGSLKRRLMEAEDRLTMSHMKMQGQELMLLFADNQ